MSPHGWGSDTLSIFLVQWLDNVEQKVDYETLQGTIICPFYMKTGTCKFGPTCRFDHPPPGEVIAKAAVQGSSGEERDAEGAAAAAEAVAAGAAAVTVQQVAAAAEQ